MQLSGTAFKDLISNPIEESPFRIIWLEGQELLLLQEARDQIIAWARHSLPHRQLYQVDNQFDWPALIHENSSFGLFDEQKLFDIRFFKSGLKAADIENVSELLQVIDQNQFIVISSEKLEKKTTGLKAFKSIEKKMAHMTFWPLPLRDYDRWINNYTRIRHTLLTDETRQWLQLQYEGNLLALKQCLDRIIHTHEKDRPLGLDQVKTHILFQAQYSPFDLADIALSGNHLKALQALKLMQSQGQEPMLILWSVNNAIEAIKAYKEHHRRGQSMNYARYKIFGPRIKLFEQGARSFPAKYLANALRLAGQVDGMIKGIIRLDPWIGLTHLVMAIAAPQSSLNAITDLDGFKDFCAPF